MSSNERQDGVVELRARARHIRGLATMLNDLQTCDSLNIWADELDAKADLIESRSALRCR
jgi:hypothetical protein